MLVATRYVLLLSVEIALTENTFSMQFCISLVPCYTRYSANRESEFHTHAVECEMRKALLAVPCESVGKLLFSISAK